MEEICGIKSTFFHSMKPDAVRFYAVSHGIVDKKRMKKLLKNERKITKITIWYIKVLFIEKIMWC